MVMDNSKRNPSTANSKNPDFKESSMGGFWEQVNKETNENEGLPSRTRRGFAKVLNSPVPKKKILAERNVVVDDAPFLAMETTSSTPKVQGIKLVISSPGPCRSSSSSVAAAYDPVTNFTSPRPEFLRYNPNRRREILQRMEVGDMKDFESSSSSSSSDQARNELDEDEEEELASLIESSASPPKSTSQKEKEEGGAKQGVEKEDSDYEVDDALEEEVEERPWSRSRMVWKLFLIFGLFFISCHYLFPTTSSITPFHQQGENGGSEEITIPQRPTNCLSRDHLLTTHMGVSDLFLSTAGEMMCPFDDGHTCSSSSSSSSLVVDDEEEIHIIIGSRPTIREEGFDDDLVTTSDEVVTGMVHSQVEVVERDEDSSQAQGADTLVAMEERDLSTSHVLFEQEDDDDDDDGQREECEQVEETLGEDEEIERNNDIHLKSEKVQASLEAPSSPLRSEDTELVEKSVHLTETPHSTAARNAPQVDQASEESKFSIISQSAFRWNQLVYFSREVPLIFIWISLLAAALVGFLSFLFKYFVKPSSPPPLLPCSKSSIDEKKTDASMVEEEMRNIEVVEEKSIKPAVMEEELSRDIDQDSRVNNLSLDQLREKYGESSYYARRQPTLQLLGEFSLAESEIGGGQTFKRIEPEREEGSEEPHSTSQYKMRSSTLRKSPSSSTNKLHPPPSTESTLEGSYTRPGKKQLRKTEESSNKSEEKMVATPLRRSDRLRKRVTSP